MSRSAAAKSAKATRAANAATTASVALVPLRQVRARRAAAGKHRRAWTIKHNGGRYAVFNVGGELRVTDARCPHNGGPLASGMVRDGAVTCPWHWYCFDLRTGECRTAAGYRLRTYPVLDRDGRLFAELPGEARPRTWLGLLRVRRPARKPAPH